MNLLKTLPMLTFWLVVILVITGCEQRVGMHATPPVDRLAKIPPGAVKVQPESDRNPPQSYSDEYEQPIPVPGGVNSAGAEDSPFILPGGEALYFFFTPDASLPAERQLMDGVTGIYFARREDSGWGEPQRIWLQDPGKLALDGCEFVLGDMMWFCSARTGYTSVRWFTAEYRDGRWQDWYETSFDPDYQVGELHISSDGQELYFHSFRQGGNGGLDIWVSELMEGEWQAPRNLDSINTPGDEGWPALSPDGSELWYTAEYSLWRAKKIDGEWGPGEKMFGPLAGEASLDAAGNVYFTHHFYDGDRMIEADIYVSYRK